MIKEKSYFCTKCLKEHKNNDNDVLYENHYHFKLIGKYYCSECQGYHYKGAIYEKHKINLINLTKEQIWKLQFDKSWKSYDIKQHKNFYGSKKQ